MSTKNWFNTPTNLTATVGLLITLSTIIASAVFIYYSFSSRLKKVEDKIGSAPVIARAETCKNLVGNLGHQVTRDFSNPGAEQRLEAIIEKMGCYRDFGGDSNTSVLANGQ